MFVVPPGALPDSPRSKDAYLNQADPQLPGRALFINYRNEIPQRNLKLGLVMHEFRWTSETLKSGFRCPAKISPHETQLARQRKTDLN